MKIYIASRFEKRNEVRRLYELLEKRGHKRSSDWTSHQAIKPYEENKEFAKQYSMEDIDGVKNSDIFILLCDKAGTGMYAEFGAAILSNIRFGRPKIYVVGSHMTTVFHFHPSVNRRKNMEEVLEEIGRM